MANDATKVRVALDLGVEGWRAMPSRETFQRFADAREALDRMEDLICTLLAEREFGPQPFSCPEPLCPVVTVGSGYDACPHCGGQLQEVAA